MKIISVWLDNDLQRRVPPSPYNVWFAHQFDKMADYVITNAYRIENISFDNDLGVALEGYQIARQIYERIHDEKILFPRLRTIRAHTGNVVAADKIIGYFKWLVTRKLLDCRIVREEYKPHNLEEYKGVIL